MDWPGVSRKQDQGLLVDASQVGKELDPKSHSPWGGAIRNGTYDYKGLTAPLS